MSLSAGRKKPFGITRGPLGGSQANGGAEECSTGREQPAGGGGRPAELSLLSANPTLGRAAGPTLEAEGTRASVWAFYPMHLMVTVEDCLVQRHFCYQVSSDVSAASRPGCFHILTWVFILSKIRTVSEELGVLLCMLRKNWIREEWQSDLRALVQVPSPGLEGEGWAARNTSATKDFSS